MYKIFLVLMFTSVFSYSQDFAQYSHKNYGKISLSDIKEGSGLAKSFTHKDVFWTFNDSGDRARIFSVNEKGETIKPQWVKDYKGIKIFDAYNLDWEALTVDRDGYMYIFDTGDNCNCRRDLAVYKLREPNPYMNIEAGIIAKYILKYPDQKDFPPSPENMNFDAEAAYLYKGDLFIISKNRGFGPAKVYRFFNLKPFEENTGEIYASFDFLSMVTDAEISPDARKLAVLTYDYIWLFEKGDGEDFFKGKAKKLKIRLGQAEGLAFSGEFILVSNEDGKVFRISVDDIK